VPKPAITGGPAFGAVQGIVLIAFILAGWQGVKRFHPITPWKNSLRQKGSDCALTLLWNVSNNYLS